MNKALLFVGAFNPPTTAHIQCAEFAMKALKCEHVIFVPSKSRYITSEQGKDMAFDNNARLAMLEKLAKTRYWMHVSDYEILAPQQPRTYETLQEMKRRGYACRLLMGSDKLVELENGWLYVEEIVKEFGIAVMGRNSDDCQAMIENNPYLKNLSYNIRIIETPKEYHSISSTALRQALQRIRQDLIFLDKALPEELHYLYSIEDRANEK